MEADIANYEVYLKEEVEKRKKYKVGLVFMTLIQIKKNLLTVIFMVMFFFSRLMIRGGLITMTSSSAPLFQCWPKKVKLK